MCIAQKGSGQYTAVHYITLQYSAVQCSTVQYSPLHCSKLCYTEIYMKVYPTNSRHCNCCLLRRVCTVYCSVLWNMVLQWYAMLCTVLYYIAMYCSALQCIAVYCNVFQCIRKAPKKRRKKGLNTGITQKVEEGYITKGGRGVMGRPKLVEHVVFFYFGPLKSF